jgi:DNA-binding transcriptional LysR family regulator
LAKREPDASVPWRAIEVRHLAALAAVAHEGSFRRAADRLGYVQSAISGQISHLERAACTCLVERSSGSATVRLTAAGRVLLSHADEIMARLQAAYADISSLESRTAGTVRVAGLERLSPRRFARILRLFGERYPLARVVLSDAGSDELNFELLGAAKVELAVGELPLHDGPFAHIVLEEDPYVLVVAAGSPLAGRQHLPSIAELAALELIIPTSCRAAARLDARLRELGIRSRSHVSVDSVATAQALVRAGLGAAILPCSLTDPSDPSTATVQLPELLPPRTTALALDAELEHTTAVYGFIRAVSTAANADRAVLHHDHHPTHPIGKPFANSTLDKPKAGRSPTAGSRVPAR